MTLLEVLDHYGVSYRRAGENRHVTDGWIGIDCPLCSPDSGKFKLGIHLTSYACSCWTCGGQWFLYTLAQATRESVEHLESILSPSISSIEPRAARRHSVAIPGSLGPLLAIHRRYLQSRGFDPDELIRLWGLRGIGLSSNLAWRLWIPVHYQDQIVSWTTRAISDEVETRYVNARKEEEVIPIKECLYGEDHTRHACVVVEGPADAWRIGAGAVATLGIVVTRSQVAKLSRFAVRVVCFDSEPQAQHRAKSLCAQLEAFPGETYRICLDAADPGSASQKEINSIRKEFLD